MTDSTTGQEIDPEGVNHPANYNQHPSGVEVIVLCRHYSFDLGNAIKYVMRAGLKDTDALVKDLSKALWYMDDAAKSQALWVKEPDQIDYQVMGGYRPLIRDSLSMSWAKVVMAETNQYRQEFALMMQINQFAAARKVLARWIETLSSNQP